MKKFVAFVLVLVFALSLSNLALAAEKIRVGASPSPHAEILNAAKDALLEKGYELEVVEFTDYILPNVSLSDGSLDANYFQHIPYLNNFNEENNADLVSAIEMHYEPFGIYPGRTATLEELADGATIAVPNDGSNETRALLLLQDAGLITLADGIDPTSDATKLDIVENPHNVNILEAEAAQLPLMLPDVDFAVINGNYALGAGLNPIEDSVAIEGSESPYLNVVVVKEGNENEPFVAALKEVLNSEEIRTFINETYGGAVVAAF